MHTSWSLTWHGEVAHPEAREVAWCAHSGGHGQASSSASKRPSDLGGTEPSPLCDCFHCTTMGPPCNRSCLPRRATVRSKRSKGKHLVNGNSYSQYEEMEDGTSGTWHQWHLPPSACSTQSAGSAAGPRNRPPSSRSGTTPPNLWYILSGLGQGWLELKERPS